MIENQDRKYWIDVLRNLLEANTVTDIVDWEIRSRDQSLKFVIEELQERLSMFVIPLSPGGVLEQQVVDINRHSIERTILFLDSGCERLPESWFARWWFAGLLLTGIASAASAALFDSSVLEGAAFVLLVPLFTFLWVAYVVQQLLMGYQIFQVRILQCDLSPSAIAADAADFWPFVSHEALQNRLVASNDTDLLP